MISVDKDSTFQQHVDLLTHHFGVISILWVVDLFHDETANDQGEEHEEDDSNKNSNNFNMWHHFHRLITLLFDENVVFCGQRNCLTVLRVFKEIVQLLFINCILVVSYVLFLSDWFSCWFICISI